MEDQKRTEKTLDAMREEAISVIAELTGDDKKRSLVIEYIFAAENARLALVARIETLCASYRQGKEPLMQPRDRILKAVAPPREQRGLVSGKNLGDPPVTLLSSPVEVDAEHVPALDTSSVEGGELLGGLDGDESRGRHGPPREDEQEKYLTSTLSAVAAECVDEFSQEFVTGIEKNSDSIFWMLAASRKEWRVDAVTLMVGKLRKRWRENGVTLVLRDTREYPDFRRGYSEGIRVGTRETVRAAQELFAPLKKPGESVVDELLAERREEARREEEKFASHPPKDPA